MTALRVGGFDLALLAGGLGVLVAAGLVASARDALRLAGLAFVVGFATVGVLVSAALTAGISMSVGLVLGTAAVAVTAGGAARVLRPVKPLEAPTQSSGRWARIATGIAVAVMLVYLAVLLRAAHGEGATNAWDAWTFWIPKAKTIFYFHGIDGGPGGITSFAQPDYPPLLPAMDAAVFEFAGRASATLLPVQEWLLLVGFLTGLAGLFWRRVPTAVLATSLALFLLMPDIGATVGQSLGDLPLSLLLGTAAACLGLWIADRRSRYLVPAAILLAAASTTKKEGLALSVVLLVACAVATLSVRRAALLLSPALAAVGATVPWRLWLSHHHVVTSGDYQLHDAFDPHFLSQRGGRLADAAGQVPRYLFDVGHWDLVLPLALLAAVLLLRRSRGLALLVLLAGALGLLGLIEIYWISLLPLSFHLQTSANRTVMPFVVIGGALLPLVLGYLLAGRRDQTAPV